MERYYKQAVIFTLSPSILIGLGRGVEVIPTTLSHAQRIIEGRSYGSTEVKILTTFDEPIDESYFSSNVNINFGMIDALQFDQIDFSTNLERNEEYSELLYITNNFTEYYLIKAL